MSVRVGRRPASRRDAQRAASDLRAMAEWCNRCLRQAGAKQTFIGGGHHLEDNTVENRLEWLASAEVTYRQLYTQAMITAERGLEFIANERLRLQEKG